MAYLSVSESGIELIHKKKPMYKSKYPDCYPFNTMHPIYLGNYWHAAGEPEDYIVLPPGTIEKLIGRALTLEDGPFEI